MVRFCLAMILDLILSNSFFLKRCNVDIEWPSEVRDLGAIQFEQAIQKIVDSRQKLADSSKSTLRLSAKEINSLFCGGGGDSPEYPNHIKATLSVTVFRIEEEKLIETVLIVSKLSLLKKRLEFIPLIENEHEFYVENSQLYNRTRVLVMRGVELKAKPLGVTKENIRYSLSLLGKILLARERL